MNNKISRLSLSLSSILWKGGLRRSEQSDRLSDFIGEVTS